MVRYFKLGKEVQVQLVEMWLPRYIFIGIAGYTKYVNTQARSQLEMIEGLGPRLINFTIRCVSVNA